MIVVTGARGRVGGAVASSLAARGIKARLVVRAAGGVRVAPSAEVTEADFEDAAALAAALSGASAALLVTNDPLRPGLDRNLADAARAAGVERVVRVSALSVAEPDADDLITRWHRECEAYLAQTVPSCTFLRPRAFMANTLRWAAAVRTGTLRLPCTQAPTACVDHRDVAEVAVRALTEPGHEGRAYPLTGPTALTAAQLVAQLAEVLGRPLRLEEISIAEARRELLGGYPAAIADALEAGLHRLAAGAKAAVEPTVRLVTGREPGTFRQWALDHRAQFCAEPGA